MASTNKKTNTSVLTTDRLAGGFGSFAAKQNEEAELRRLVLACLLWEDNAYIDGNTIAESIRKLIPQVNPEAVANIAVEARFGQKLRHIPLFICREMARLDTHKHLVASTLEKVIFRPDEMTEFLSIYWADNANRKTLSAQVKLGLSGAFRKFNEYQLAKYNRNKDVKLRDVLRLVHPTPDSVEQCLLWEKLLKDELAVPDTWEVNISKVHTPEDKKNVWERLISERKLGASAFLKNMRNMVSVGVNSKIISDGLQNINAEMLLPLDFFKAAKYAPGYIREIEDALYKCMSAWPKLSGTTILVVDTSGSMARGLASKSEFSRMDAAIAMSILASEMCERVHIYATAGNDFSRIHSTAKIKPFRGFALGQEITRESKNLGTGGIFTRQCLEYISSKEEAPDRIVVFSDSQDCDHPNKTIPNPFGKRNYIVDVSSHNNGINYKGRWTAEISGWSEGFLKYISAVENSFN